METDTANLKNNLMMPVNFKMHWYYNPEKNVFRSSL